MSYLCTCPSKGLFEGADGSIRCVACAQPEEIEAEIVRLRAERDRARAERDEACADLGKAHAERESMRRERDDLRAAAVALVATFDAPKGDVPTFCDAPKCSRLASRYDGDQASCDEHETMLVEGDIEDLSYAPQLRTLRALLGGAS